MNLVTALKRASMLAVLAACLYGGQAQAQLQVFVGYPPSEFIATSTPVYFEGHAAYFFNDRWYWRDARGWRMYREEPVYLREYRGHHPVARRYYERRREERFHRR